jgi:hypothetical protein
MYLPLNYEQINIDNSTFTPTTLKSRNNKSFGYWQRSLFQRACSIVNFELPENWQGSTRDFFYWCLFRYGYVAIFEHPDYGFTFQPCTLSGYNWYYQPARAIVTNPAINKSLEMEVEKDCAILKLTPDFRGIFDCIDYYAEKLSNLDNAINMSIINGKFAMIFGAKNKPGAQLIKKLLDKINQGEPAVVYDEIISQNLKNKDDPQPWSYWERDVKKTYLTTEQLQDMITLLNQFDNEIGIPTVPYQKKERMVTSEADSKIIDSTARSVVWRDCLISCNKVIIELFNRDLKPSLRYDPDVMNNSQEVVDDE